MNIIQHHTKQIMNAKLYWLVVLPFTAMTISCDSSTTTTTSSDTTVTDNLKQAGGNIKDAANAAATNIKQSADSTLSNIKREIAGNPDSEFVVNALNTNRNEIILLEAGIKIGTTRELKEHARMMLVDHNKLNSRLQGYATEKHYAALTKDWAGKDLSDMSTKKGTAWDKAWATKMTDGHKDDVSIFEAARNNVKDSEIKSLIDNTLPTLHAHLDMMINLKNDLK
jgi:putative membrane protein